MMRLALAAAFKDLRVRMRDPLGFAVWIGIPLAIGGLMWLAGGGGSGPQPRAPVYVDDRDDTFVSRLIARAFGQFGDLFEVRELDADAARARLNDGDGSALIVIPEGFTQALVDDEPTTLELVTNPSQRILPGIARDSLEMLPDLVFYAHRVLGDELRGLFDQFGDGEPTDAQIVAVSLAVKRTIERVREQLFPPVIVLELEASEKETEDATDFARAFFPSLIFMTMMFLAQGLAEDLWKEKAQGALRRIAAAPSGFATLLLGKLAAAVVITAAIVALALALGWALFDLDPARLGVAFLWLLAVGAAFYVGFALINLCMPSERAASIVGNLILFPLLMVGGSFFPFETMPEGMQSIGRWTPNGWALLHLKDVLSGGESTLARAALVLVLGTAVGFALAARRLGGGFLRI